jgi:hypothetical protein
MFLVQRLQFLAVRRRQLGGFDEGALQMGVPLFRDRSMFLLARGLVESGRQPRIALRVFDGGESVGGGDLQRPRQRRHRSDSIDLPQGLDALLQFGVPLEHAEESSVHPGQGLDLVAVELQQRAQLRAYPVVRPHHLMEVAFAV